jgi:hypothetical protein
VGEPPKYSTAGVIKQGPEERSEGSNQSLSV